MKNNNGTEIKYLGDIKRGDRVKIISKVSGVSHRKNQNGIITKINGSYIYVRPMYCKWEVELYPTEIRLIRRK